MLFVNNNLRYIDFLKIVKDTVSKQRFLTGKRASQPRPTPEAEAGVSLDIEASLVYTGSSNETGLIETVNRNFGNSFDLLVVGSEVDCLDGNGGNI